MCDRKLEPPQILSGNSHNFITFSKDADSLLLSFGMLTREVTLFANLSVLYCALRGIHWLG